MKTIKDTGPQLLAVHTNESRPEIPKGKLRLTFVRYSVVEYPLTPEFNQTEFRVHDAHCEEARIIAGLVKK
jgi:hypothetical protein